jgi:hypothetical protein
VHYHAATHSCNVGELPYDPNGLTVPQPSLYCGIVDQAHVDAVRELAASDDVPRIFKTHPRDPHQFFVVRDDGLLDHYVGITADDDEEVA